MSLGVSVARNLELFIPRLIPIFLVAALSYRYLEQPMIRQGRELAQRLLERGPKPAENAASAAVLGYVG